MNFIPRKESYRHPELQHLTEGGQASRDDLLQRINRAESLLGELDPTKTYRFEDLCQRIASRTFGRSSGPRITGREARHDLMLLVEDLSDMAALPAEAAGERVLSVEQLATEMNVSTKTISRWRRQGLVSRRFLFDNRRQVGFLESSVRRFVATNPDRVERGARFSQMTPEERQDVLDRAKRLAAEGAVFADVIKKLVIATGRSGETLRSMLKRHDLEHPEQAIFADQSGELRPEIRRKLLQLHEQGETLEALARRFRRSRACIGRNVQKARVERIGELSLDYIPNAEFTQVKTSRADRDILSEAPPAEGPTGQRKPPRDLPPYLARLYEIPLLTHEQERHLFRKMNYLKYKAAKLRAAIDLERPNPGTMDRIERLYRQAVDVKNQIVSANLRLVVSIAKRHAGHSQDFFELVSDGNISLMRAVEKYDFSRGFKFSTYASWAIMKNFSRSIPDEQQRRRRYSTGATEALAVTEDRRTDQHDLECRQTWREAAVERILRRLDSREKEIIAHRFGLHGEQWLTLKQVGSLIGVTKERARQLEARAISKLREAARDEQLPVEDLAGCVEV